MRPLRAAWRDYREAVARFTPPARGLLATEALLWTGHGVSQVLFNLYLLEAGLGPPAVGHAISLLGVGFALATLPASVLARRWGLRRTILLGVAVDGLGQLLRCLSPWTPVMFAASALVGVGQSFIQVAAAPFMSEHSTPRERTHLFSTFFALSLVAGVAGSLLGGWLPRGLEHLPSLAGPGLLGAYRLTLAAGAAFSLAGLLPLARLGVREDRGRGILSEPMSPEVRRRLVPIGVNGLLIGAGAGLVIPFMNLYFAQRFRCSSAQIGSFFSVAQLSTAAAALLAPATARRFGKLRSAVAAQLLSLPFLVTLGFENRLGVAVAAFWVRATLMQASTPLLGTFVMEALPPEQRATATGVINLLWNVGWAASATLAGGAIQRFGYSVPFAITATLYAAAALYFYSAFRGTPEADAEPRLSEEAKGHRGEGP